MAADTGVGRDEGEGARPGSQPGSQPGALRVRALRVRSPTGRRLLDVDALDIAHGEFVVLAGPSGAGKSTLLFTLAGLQAPDEGCVRWGSTDIAVLDDARRARFRNRRAGLVFQDLLLFDELSALDNASLAGAWQNRARGDAIRGRAAEWLKRLGIDALDGRRVATLSGGERQRVAVARALAVDPEVLLADEPTASLDRAAADRLVSTLRDIGDQRARTLVVVSHDPALLDAADRVVRLVDGRLAGEQP